MAAKGAGPRSFTAGQVAAFGVARHGLTAAAGRAPVADICRDTAGIQAQVMTQSHRCETSWSR